MFQEPQELRCKVLQLKETEAFRIQQNNDMANNIRRAALIVLYRHKLVMGLVLVPLRRAHWDFPHGHLVSMGKATRPQVAYLGTEVPRQSEVPAHPRLDRAVLSHKAVNCLVWDYFRLIHDRHIFPTTASNRRAPISVQRQRALLRRLASILLLSKLALAVPLWATLAPVMPRLKLRTLKLSVGM